MHFFTVLWKNPLSSNSKFQNRTIFCVIKLDICFFFFFNFSILFFHSCFCDWKVEQCGPRLEDDEDDEDDKSYQVIKVRIAEEVRRSDVGDVSLV